MSDSKYTLFREGAEAGVLGALAVAIWFLVMDVVRTGMPFLMPSVLGQVVLFGRETPVMEAIPEAIAAYTVVHFLAFILFGMMVAYLVELAVREPVFRYLLVMVFVIFEVFFLGLMFTMFTGALGLFPLWHIIGANTLAAAIMGLYFRYRHPAIVRASAEPLGAETT
jgi:hypothetical protein